MSKHLLTSIKSQSLGMGMGYCSVLQSPPGDSHVRPGFHSFIQAVNYRGTGHKLRSRVDGLTQCLPYMPVLVAKSENSLLSPHITQFLFWGVVCLVVVVMFSLYTVDLYCRCFDAFECRSPIDICGVLLL